MYFIYKDVNCITFSHSSFAWIALDERAAHKKMLKIVWNVLNMGNSPLCATDLYMFYCTQAITTCFFFLYIRISFFLFVFCWKCFLMQRSAMNAKECARFSFDCCKHSQLNLIQRHFENVIVTTVKLYIYSSISFSKEKRVAGGVEESFHIENGTT